MTEKLFELLKTLENLETNELLKVKLWVELNLQNRKNNPDFCEKSSFSSNI